MLLSSPEVSYWVSRQLGMEFDPARGTGIGQLDTQGNICVGAHFCDYDKQNVNVHISKIPDTRLNPTFVAAFIAYPFTQLRVVRLTGLIGSRKANAIQFAVRLGGVFEGRIRRGLPDDDLLVFGLVNTDAQRWLTARNLRRLHEGYFYGKAKSASPA